MENSAEKPQNTHVEILQAFETTVLVDGTPCILECSVFDKPPNAHLALRLPTGELERLKDAGVVIPREVEQGGVIGFINAIPSKTDAADVYLRRILSSASSLSADTKYAHVHVGRFLLDNFLALADEKKWRVSVAPESDGPSRSNWDIRTWMESRGFVFPNDAPIGIRQPRAPDTQQPIIAALKSEL